MRTKLSLLILTLLILVPATATQAQDQVSLEALERKVEALQAQIDRLEGADPDVIAELERKIEILTREIESLKIDRGAPAEADEFDAGLGQAASKIYRSGNGFSFGGYGEMIYENYDGTRDDGAASGRSDQIDFLRAIIYMGYKFNDWVLFNSEIEVEHADEIYLEFAYLDFMLRPEANVRAGLLLLPIGIVNELHEPTAFLGAMRPLTESSIIPSTWRENGAGLYGEVGSFSYRAYIVNGLRGEAFSATGLRGGRQKGSKALAEDFAFAGRLDWSPVEGVMLGGSLYQGDSGQDLNVDAGTRIVELHGDARLRGWWLRGLWSRADLDDVTGLNHALGLTGSSSVGEELTGWYGEVGYDLSTVFDMGEASVIPFVRWEQVNTQDAVPAGFSSNPANDVDVLTVGASWKPIPQAVIKFDYQDYENAAGTGVDQFNLGIGYIF